jgi:polysaccharide transporter, PST family
MIRAAVTDSTSTKAPAAPEAVGDRIDLKGRSLRSHTVRGSLINSVYVVGLSSLSLVKGFLVAGFLTTSQYGVWGIVSITLVTILWLKEIGVGDKFVQQSDEDQELAFQRAFTMEVLVTGGMLALMLLVTPLIAFVYGQPQVIGPLALLALALPAAALNAPLWIFYRRMEFAKQRSLQAIEPVVSFTVTVALAASGAGFWSLVIGAVAGIWTSAAVTLAFSPYKLAFRFERGTLSQYFDFSWPLFVASASAIVMAQGAILGGETTLGLAGAGAIALAATITNYADRIDQIITFTLYPAICAVKDRTDLLFESFVKSNRLALIWGLPFGVGLALFAPDLVHFGIGDRWEPAIFLFQIFGINTAIYQIGFNWNAFYRARADTRPIAVVSVLTALAFVGVALPLMSTHGLDGFAVGMIVVTLVNFAGRTYYLMRLFPALDMARHAGRAMAPAVPAVLGVLAMRLFEASGRTALDAGVELTVYAVVTVAATLYFERTLLLELLGYFRAPPRPEVDAVA